MLNISKKFYIFLRTRLQYEIRHSWNNIPVDHSVIKIELCSLPPNVVELKVEAPLFSRNSLPNALPGQPLYRLWEFEGTF